jgi:hypothetical protein
MNYQGDDFASMPIGGGTVMPYQSISFDGRLALNANTVGGLIIAFAAAMAGQDTAYNEDNISLTMTVNARVMGIVPYSQTHEYTFAEFRRVMGAQLDEEFACN